MKTIYTLLVCLLIGLHELRAQGSGPQLGINVVPLIDRTIELNATLIGKPEYEVFVHGGYSLPKFYPSNQNENYYTFWEGEASGAYLRAGTRVFVNKTGRLRMYLGPYLTAGYLDQKGKGTHIITCLIGRCVPWESEGRSRQYSLSAGLTSGVRTQLLPQLTLDVGVQANRFIFDKPLLDNQKIYIPGYGRQPFQGVASVQYTLKGR